MAENTAKGTGAGAGSGTGKGKKEKAGAGAGSGKDFSQDLIDEAGKRGNAGNKNDNGAKETDTATGGEGLGNNLGNEGNGGTSTNSQDVNSQDGGAGQGIAPEEKIDTNSQDGAKETTVIPEEKKETSIDTNSTLEAGNTLAPNQPAPDENEGFPVFPKDDPAKAKENHDQRVSKYGEGYIVAILGNFQSVWSKVAWERMDGQTDWKEAKPIPAEVLAHYRGQQAE